MSDIKDFEIENGTLIRYKGASIQVEIPTGVMSIESFAFKDCKEIESIKIPKTVASIGYFAFFCCDSLEKIEVEEGCYEFRSEGNCVIKTGREVVVLGCKNSKIPESGTIVGIGNYAFSGCVMLDDIKIPSSIEFLGEGAFYGCAGLESVVLPDSVTCIGQGAFKECYNLESIAIPDSVSLIGREAFDGCSENLVIIAKKDSYTEEYAIKNKLKLKIIN